jgi:hypothetical protein
MGRESSSLDKGLIDAWKTASIGSHPRFVVIDVLQGRSPPQFGRNAYENDYSIIAPSRNGRPAWIGVLALHHTRKGVPEIA